MATKPGVPLGKNVPQGPITHHKQEKAESDTPPRQIKHEANEDPSEDPQMRTPKSGMKETHEDRGRDQEKPHRVQAGVKGARRLVPESTEKLLQRQFSKRIRAIMSSRPTSLDAKDPRSSQIRTSSHGSHLGHNKQGTFERLMKKLHKSEMRKFQKQKLQKLQIYKEQKLRN